MPDNIGLAVIICFTFLKAAIFMMALVVLKMVLLINHTLSCFLYSYTRLRTSYFSTQGLKSAYAHWWITRQSGEPYNGAGGYYSAYDKYSVVLKLNS